MMLKASFAAVSLALVAAGAVLAPDAGAGVLDRLRQDKTLRIAYRQDAPPFSFQTGSEEPQGYIVSICRAVGKSLGQQLQLPNLNIVYVPVTATDRFDAIRQQKADLLCEATTATLSRREAVDFSIATFVDGASLLIRSDGPQNLQAMAGQKIGVLGGTTTQEALNNSLQEANVTADVIPAKTHEEGIAMLDAGTIAAYFADRAILQSLIKQSKDPKKLLLADNYLTVEPYALALPKGDEDFRLAVDRALSHLYRDGEISTIFAESFKDGTSPSGILKTLYLITGLPD
jgi:polar amino acid transport system substrate-binding protein/glutamate/aspartate transport system substrate-binding protein